MNIDKKNREYWERGVNCESLIFIFLLLAGVQAYKEESKGLFDNVEQKIFDKFFQVGDGKINMFVTWLRFPQF